MDTSIKISRLASADAASLEQINSLVPQLNPNLRPLTLDRLSAIIQAEANDIYVATDESTNRIIGTALLVTIHQFAGTKCWVEDVVVSSDYRGLGIGRQLMQTILAAASKKTDSINLTSNPRRTSAHRLYTDLGFKVRDTTVFRFTPDK